MKRCAATIIAAILFNAIILKASDAPDANTIYDSDTNHLWNRLNQTLFERTAQDGKKYGLNELDILYWNRTTNLLAGVSHQQAISVLDEFINAHGEKLIHDPLKHALLQRDLWELFDWTASPWPSAPYAPGRKELQNRLAVIMRRLALTTNEIASLLDNYSTQAETEKLPDLPQGLFQTNGDWVNLAPDPNGNEETAPAHDHSSGGRSAFLVMLRLPAGRQAALSYLEQLNTFEHFWVYQTNQFATTNSPHEILTLNTNLPEFPTNTEWAIVRRMSVIDTDGNIQPTRIVESIQLRRYFAFTPPTMLMITNDNGSFVPIDVPPQDLYEFQMNRRRNSALREIAKNEKDFLFVHFMGMGIDPFEWKSSEPQVPDSSTFKSTVLQSCRTCHAGPGIYSVNVYAGIFSGLFRHSIDPHELFNLDTKRETDAAIDWKREQYSWGLLQGLWRQEN
jgi:hypothetical protein